MARRGRATSERQAAAQDNRSAPQPLSRGGDQRSGTMNELDFAEREDDVIDLGTASEATLGIDDPVMRESLVMPHTRDF